MSGDFHTDADHGFPYSQDVITRLHGMAEVYRHFSQGKEVRTADLLDEAAGCISALMENMSAPSRGPYLMPLAVRLASERVRADAANTMRHDTTSDLSARLMCRVGVHDLGLVMAWVDQFAALALLPGGVPDREAIARVISDHVRQINRVVASGMHEGPAIQAAADAIIAMLSASPKGSSRSQPSRTAQEPPSPTPCDLDQKSWEVEVRLQGTRILTLGHDHLAGVYDIDKYADAVRTCGEHLLAFIGNGEPVECFACHGSQQERWVGNGGNEEVGPCSVCCPDADTSGTNDQSRDEQNPSASPKEVR